ncbi:hypothetical protein [Streptomyces sp. AC550_RSS872]|uniref:hypothetical protein n=1 Tax=Streptomyces sp. AC550_RSS872 TaxID=2823689 RepID=UPI0020B901B1|nr:hypothetical protein [Streptomyces sp. AC550_RSS872]
MRANLELIAATTRRPRELPEHLSRIRLRLRLRLRLGNIEATALRAQELGAGVLIW